MLKPERGKHREALNIQPPSGGCVLKRDLTSRLPHFADSQPPSGGCVLKRPAYTEQGEAQRQPPSGGCVLKQYLFA